MKTIQLSLILILLIFCGSCSRSDVSPSDNKEFNDFYSYLSSEKLDGVKLSKQKIKWRHWDVAINPDNTAKSGEHKIVEQEFEVVVLENNYTALTLLPEYGGRLLSYYFKPTKHEQLYQNPVGTPYGFNSRSFYYDWLMVYGGLFPTFPEPEHGKAWLVPWQYKIVENSKERIAVEMRYTDDKNNRKGIPVKFNGNATGLTCVVTYSLEKNSTVAQMSVELINNKDEAVAYEYWTCITFAPGSTPQDTKTTAGAEMLVPIYNVNANWAPSGWMGSEPVQRFDKYNEFTEWKDMGILYAHPRLYENWYGVVNHDNEEAFIRIGDNNKTPGLKFWTWGYDNSKSISEEQSFLTGERPYIELWSGTTLKFFDKTSLAARSNIKWDEFYYPTIGLKRVDYANEAGAIALDLTDDVTGYNYSIYMSEPGVEYSLIIKSGSKNSVIGTFIQQADKSIILSAPAPDTKGFTVKVVKNDKVVLEYFYEQ